jgi:uroporphyrinogen decarboxylase
MKRSMSCKERVLTAIAHQEPDRVPVNYRANAGIDRRLKTHFGLRNDDNEGLRQALEVDLRYVRAPYVGPKLHEDVPGRRIDIWGVHTRWIEHETGGYWDFCDFPLKDALPAEIDAWPVPLPDDFDYSQIGVQCRRWQPYCVAAGSSGLGTIINRTGKLRMMQQVLIDLITDEPAVLRYIERKQRVELEITHRTLEAAQGGIDLLIMGEDLSTQIGPMISLELYRKHLRPSHQTFVDLAQYFGIPVMFHSCGSSSWVFDDLIEMGIDVVDTLQPEAKDMAPKYLKDRFGDRLAFHGCISTGGPVAYGTVQEVVKHVRETLEIMMPGGGYILVPSHQLQDNSPTENVLATYESAHTYGRYYSQ